MSLSRTQEEEREKRKAHQLWRAVNRDFPWLWAVLQKWEPGSDEVRVKTMSRADLHCWLLDSSGEREIWAQVRCNMVRGKQAVIEVVKVPVTIGYPGEKRDPGNWAQRILSILQYGGRNSIDHLVEVVERKSWQGILARVLRPPKDADLVYGDAFNDLLRQCERIGLGMTSTSC